MRTGAVCDRDHGPTDTGRCLSDVPLGIDLSKASVDGLREALSAFLFCSVQLDFLLGISREDLPLSCSTFCKLYGFDAFADSDVLLIDISSN